MVCKDTGFVCPDWPPCNGMLFPTWIGLVAVEMVHSYHGGTHSRLGPVHHRESVLASRLDFTVVTLHFANAGSIMAIMTWVAITSTSARQRTRKTADRLNLTAVPNPGTVH